MSLDKEEILSELGSVMNKLQSANCGCIGNMFSPKGCQNPGYQSNCHQGGHHNYGHMPCAGEPCPMACKNACQRRCGGAGYNAPKMISDTYGYLKDNVMRPVVNEVYNDLKSLNPTNTIANNPLASQMGLTSNSPTVNMGDSIGKNIAQQMGMTPPNPNMGQGKPTPQHNPLNTTDGNFNVHHNHSRASNAPFNDMFKDISSGALGFDPMAIAKQMNPANEKKAAINSMNKVMMGSGNPARNRFETIQEHVTPVGQGQYQSSHVQQGQMQPSSMQQGQLHPMGLQQSQLQPLSVQQGQMNSVPIQQGQILQPMQQDLMPVGQMQQGVIQPQQMQQTFQVQQMPQVVPLQQGQMPQAIVSQPQMQQPQIQQPQMQQPQMQQPQMQQPQMQQPQMQQPQMPQVQMPQGQLPQDGQLHGYGQLSRHGQMQQIEQARVSHQPDSIYPTQGQQIEKLLPAYTQPIQVQQGQQYLAKQKQMQQQNQQLNEEKFNTLGQPVQQLPARLYNTPIPPGPQTLAAQPAFYPPNYKVKGVASKTSITGRKSNTHLKHFYNVNSTSYPQLSRAEKPSHDGNVQEKITFNNTADNVNLPVNQRLMTDMYRPMPDSAVPTQINPADQPGTVGAAGDNLPKTGEANALFRSRNGLQDHIFRSKPISVAWSFHGERQRYAPMRPRARVC